MRINQNIAAFNAYRNLNTTQNQLGKSLEKLSSGFRINRAADDAAGLVISEGLRAQVRGLQQATRNAQDGISVVQTAEGGLNEVHAMLQRMRELAVQSANDSNDTASRAAAQAEVEELLEEVNRVAAETSFGKVKLLDGSFGKTAGTLSGFVAAAADFDGDEVFTVNVTGGSGAVNVALDNTGALEGQELANYLTSKIRSALEGTGNAVDAAAAGQISVTSEAVGSGHVLTVVNNGDADVALADGANTPLASDLASELIGTVSAASGTGGVFQVGANKGETISFSISDLTGLAAGIDVSTQDGAADAIEDLDTAINTVSTERGKLGAIQNRLESTIANLSVTVENVQASESRIRDTDMAAEMVQFTRSQILQQAGTAMLAQANQVPQSVLSLLR